MAVKSEPIDIDSELPVLFTRSANGSPGGRSSARDDSGNASSQPLNLTSHPVNFLTERGRPEMVVDPVHNDVMFLPPHPPLRGGDGGEDGGHGEGSGSGGGGGRTSRGEQRVSGRREVTEYATYTISHHEAELNSKLLPKKYRCRFCVYKTSYKSDLNRHLRKHGIAPQHCPLCNMPFKTSGNLENHMRQTHGDMAAGILPPSPSSSSSSAALPGLCLDGFLSPAAALALGAPPALPPVVGGVVVPCVGIPPSTSSSDLIPFEPSRGRGSSGGHHHHHHPRHNLSRRLESQLQQDFPALSQAVLSPAQLSCHMCSFVCSDSEVLARHLLTHPAEEEVSRALALRDKPDEGSVPSPPVPLGETGLRRSPALTPERRSPLSVTKLACNYCGAILSSIDELQLHRLSCVDPAENLQRTHGEDLRRHNSTGSQRQDNNKDDSGEASASAEDSYQDAHVKNVEANRESTERAVQGLPRQETMEKLRRTLANQAVSGDPSDRRSAPSLKQAPHQQLSSMILPHIPATENTDSGNTIARKRSGSDTLRDSHDTGVVRIVIGSDDSLESVLICEDETLQHSDSDNQHSSSHAPGRSDPETAMTKPARELVTCSDEDSECERSAGKSTEGNGGNRRSTCSPARKDTASAPASCDALPDQAEVPTPPKRARKSPLRHANSSPIDLSSFQHRRDASERDLELFRRDDNSIKEEANSLDASLAEEAYQSDGGCASVTYEREDFSCQTERAGDCHGVHTHACTRCDKIFIGKDQLFSHLQRVHGLSSGSVDSSSMRNIKIMSQSISGSTADSSNRNRICNLRHSTSGKSSIARREDVSKSSRTILTASAVVIPVTQAPTSGNIITESHPFSRRFSPAVRQRKSSARPATEVTSHPPTSGRYAKLVSDFDEFARQPYACSLCFFRTARLGELRSHVHNHLTGGTAAPVPETARLEPMEAFSVERGTSPGVRNESCPGLRSASPDVRSVSSSVRSNSPGGSSGSPDLRIINSPVVRCSPPCVRNASPGVSVNSGVTSSFPGVGSTSPEARCDSSLVEYNSPGIKRNSPGIKVTFPAVRNADPGVRSTSPSFRISCGPASSAGSPTPAPRCGVPVESASCSAERLVISPPVRRKSTSPSSLGSQTPEYVSFSDVPTQMETISTERGDSPCKRNSVSRPEDAPAEMEQLSAKMSAFPGKMSYASAASSATHGSLVSSSASGVTGGDVSFSTLENARESVAPPTSDSGVSVVKTQDPAIHGVCGGELNVVVSDRERSSSSSADSDELKITNTNSPAPESATTEKSSQLSPHVLVDPTASSVNEPRPLDLTSVEKTEALEIISNVTGDDVTSIPSNDSDDDNNNIIRRGEVVQTETATSASVDDGNKTVGIHRKSSPPPSDMVEENTRDTLLPVAKLPNQESSSHEETRGSRKSPINALTEESCLSIAEGSSTERSSWHETMDSQETSLENFTEKRAMPIAEGSSTDSSSRCGIQNSQKPSLDKFTENRSMSIAEGSSMESISRHVTHDSINLPLDELTENESVPTAEESSTNNMYGPDVHSDDVIGELTSHSQGLITGSEQPSNTAHTATHTATRSSKKDYPSPLSLSSRKPAVGNNRRSARKTAWSTHASRKGSRFSNHIVSDRKRKSAIQRWQKLSRKPSGDLLSGGWSTGLGCKNSVNNRCSHCGKSFSLRQLLVRHMRCIH